VYHDQPGFGHVFIMIKTFTAKKPNTPPMMGIIEGDCSYAVSDNP
jgi:hypothetical protein